VIACAKQIRCDAGRRQPQGGGIDPVLARAGPARPRAAGAGRVTPHCGMRHATTLGMRVVGENGGCETDGRDRKRIGCRRSRGCGAMCGRMRPHRRSRRGWLRSIPNAGLVARGRAAGGLRGAEQFAGVADGADRSGDSGAAAVRGRHDRCRCDGARPGVVRRRNRFALQLDSIRRRGGRAEAGSGCPWLG
jgi:hypothetical protein